MGSEEQYFEKLERAKKRVKELKDFYGHLKAYIIVNALLLLFRGGVVSFIFQDSVTLESGFQDWLHLNFVFFPVLWGIGLLVHGLIAYRNKFSFLKKWEENQIRKYMEEDKRNSDKYN
ncbi:MAG: 2TM domain-containing protein [Eudoraea sp.]|nr:2TM domain-containing protein [Eudoraea sp.]